MRRAFPKLLTACLLAAAATAQGATSDPFAGLADKAPAEQRASVAFLLEHMPASDRQALTPEFVLQQVALAHAARARAPWGQAISDKMFAGYVLPYAQANEKREDWRTDLAARCAPMVEDCKTPGEAALALNQKLFADLKVHYSTQRRAADQCPSESIAQGKASCTGLAILLADACRSVCVPARLVSVKWPHKDGNHTWVEVWDGAAWRFVGADEPDPAGFDRAWFVGDAAQCAKADREHRVWAVSFAETGQRFAAGWGRGIELNGIDVSARYAPKAEAQGGQDQADPKAAADAAVSVQLARFFAADAEAQAKFEFDRNLDAELRTVAGDARLRALAFAAFRAAEHQDLRAEFEQHTVKAGDKVSAYTVKTVGERPQSGYALVIAMHGGGGAPKAVNDQQWQHMQIYYKDHPEAGGYRYVALRAPTDEWNGFYTGYIYPVIERLIRQFVVCGDVDPDKVFAIGYSHGGYGAFAIGPMLADRFAAVHASASAPTDGETKTLNLRHLRFSFMVGEKDTAYGRRERCEKFDALIKSLRGERTDLYPVTFEFKQGFAHGGLPDRDKLATLLGAVRGAPPRDLTWEPGSVRAHWWLAVGADGGQRVDAELQGQKLLWKALEAKSVTARLDARLCDLTKPLTIVGASTREVMPAPSLRTLCSSLQLRGDPQLAWTFEVSLQP